MSDNDDGKSDPAKSFEKARTLQPSSKLEKDALERQRETPVRHHVPTPDGNVVRETHTMQSAAREARIKEIEASLKRSRDQKDIRRSFNRNNGPDRGR